MTGPSRARDRQTRFHELWLGLAQPVEGLVFSVPVLADAQIAPRVTADLTARFRHCLADRQEDDSEVDPGASGPQIRSLEDVFQSFLGYTTPGMLVLRDDLPPHLSFYAAEGQQEIRPSFAVARGPFASAEEDPFGGFGTDPDAAGSTEEGGETPPEPPVLLAWDLRRDLPEAPDEAPDLDKAETRTGPWRYPPGAKMERLLRHAEVPVGLVSNGAEVRLIYAPRGETTSHLTFRVRDMMDPEGRPLLAAFELLLGAARCYQAAPEHTLEGLLEESRRRQADVTKDLAEQVSEAVEILLQGFEQAWLRQTSGSGRNWLRAALEEPGDHFYQGILSVVLRLVFLLYAEDQGTLPVHHPLYRRHLSVQGLYDALVEDAGFHPESMHHRFGAYGRLVTLFRAVFLGVQHGDLFLPPRRGRLFDPNTYPFLEGGLPGTTAAIRQPEDRAAVRPPQLDDGVIYQVLGRLILFQGQRLSYQALDVEQIGSVYESLMGFHVLRLNSPAVRLGKNRVWVEVAGLRQQSPREAQKWLKEVCKLAPAQCRRVLDLVQAHPDDEALAQALLELAAGRRGQSRRHSAPAGRLVLQPGEERRRSGSHYTPRSLTTPIVARTLEPLLRCLGAEPTEEQVLSLKICDPAMGSGAFLVETCRQLAQALVDVWVRQGRGAAVAEEHGDPDLHARRLVAQRCLYGVDKNPAAVELAKLSLWIVTLASDLPFTFLDHALRHGDSLVGLDLEQVAAFHWQPQAQPDLFAQPLRDALEQSLAHRQELVALAHQEDPGSQQEKRRLLDHARAATATVRMVADVCVGAFFAKGKSKEREKERQRRLALVEKYFEGDLSLEPELRGLAEEIREQHDPFHWWLELPEVFYEERPDPLAGGECNGAAYMEGFVGNPPFMGGKRISDELGAAYNEWLALVPKATRNADISAHFFRRAARLLGRHGSFGLVSTNTIAQGETRVGGLQALLAAGWTIYDATSSMPWPGNAAVTVSIVHAAYGSAAEELIPKLDATTIDAINSRLRPKPERADVIALRSNAEQAFVGSYVLGMGFTLSSDEREALVAKSTRNAELIFPYLGGQEVNSSPTQAFERYVINFGQMSLEEAGTWPDLIAIVRKTVKPEREKKRRDQHRKKWWQFADFRPGLYRSLQGLDRCLVTACLSKHVMFSFQPTNRVFSHQLYAFPLDNHTAFAVLQSRLHEHWARLLSSSMKTDLRYTGSQCFATFPFPDPNPRTVLPVVEEAGQALYERRAAFMINTNQGLTQTYNSLKDPDNHDPQILELRRLHEAMDRAVLDAYGWNNVEVPPFCPLDEADQAAALAFEDEVIDRLYVLNAERARQEQRQGLGASPRKRSRKKHSTIEAAGQDRLFDEGEA